MTGSTERLRRDIPQTFNMYELPRDDVSIPGFLASARGSILSHDGRSGATTLLVELPPTWVSGPTELGTAEFYVLEGGLSVEQVDVGPGGFLAVPRGGRARVASPQGAKAVLIWEPELDADFYYGSQPYWLRPWEQPWSVAARPGDEPLMPGAGNGSLYKSLRPRDDNDTPLRGGPNGFLRLFTFLPGYGFPCQDVHRQSWEEVLFLTGDCLMADRGVLGPGSYVGNPRGMLHGPMVSQKGCLMLIHNSAPQGFETYDTFPDARPLVEWYLQNASLYQEPSTIPWEETMAYRAWKAMGEGERASAFPTYLEDDPS